MEVDIFTLFKADNKRQIVGIAPSALSPEQVLVTVQSQAVYLYNVRIFCLLLVNNFVAGNDIRYPDPHYLTFATLSQQEILWGVFSAIKLCLMGECRCRSLRYLLLSRSTIKSVKKVGSLLLV